MIWLVGSVLVSLVLLILAVYHSDSQHITDIQNLSKKVALSEYSLSQTKAAFESAKLQWSKDFDHYCVQRLAFEKSLKTEIDLMVVRQRTLEKKIVASERTVNLYVNPKDVMVAQKKSSELLKRAGLNV
jgi:hypothetical protein